MPYKPTQAQLMQDLLDGKKMRRTSWNKDIAIYLCPIKQEIRYCHLAENDDYQSMAVNKLKNVDGKIEWEEYKPKQTKPVIDWKPESIYIDGNDRAYYSLTEELIYKFIKNCENGIREIINWINNHETDWNRRAVIFTSDICKK